MTDKQGIPPINPEFFLPDFIDVYGGYPFMENAVINISGAKNEVLGSIAAAVLTDKPLKLRNVPHIQDVLDLGMALIELGVKVDYDPKTREMNLCAKNITSNVLSNNTMKFRASYYLWGALLSRFAITKEFNSIEAKLPGGCNFGNRGYDFHFDLLRQVLGADIKNHDNGFTIVLPAHPNTSDTLYSTRAVSHGATFHYLLTSSITNKTDYMYNTALEPECASLIHLLRMMGAENIRGQNATAIISGAHKGLLNGGEYTIKPDRMETGFYALLALATRSRVCLHNVDLYACRPWMNLLQEFTHRRAEKVGNNLDVIFDFRDIDFGKLCGKNIIVSPFPGKETDMEQLWLSVLPMANSASTIIDPIWPGRLGTPEQADEILKFGINMKYNNAFDGNALKIDIAPSNIHAVPDGVYAANLRGAAGMIIAAAVADGKTRIYKPGFAMRGHPNLIQNMQSLGIKIDASSTGQHMNALPYPDTSRQR